MVPAARQPRTAGLPSPRCPRTAKRRTQIPGRAHPPADAAEETGGEWSAADPPTRCRSLLRAVLEKLGRRVGWVSGASAAGQALTIEGCGRRLFDERERTSMSSGSAGCIHVGTANWSDHTGFYPTRDEAGGAGTHYSRTFKLAYYASRLGVVEVNASFYRRIDPSVYAQWAEQTPDRLQVPGEGAPGGGEPAARPQAGGRVHQKPVECRAAVARGRQVWRVPGAVRRERSPQA